MKTTKIFFLLLGISLFSGCSDLKEENITDSPQEIKLTQEIKSFIDQAQFTSESTEDETIKDRDNVLVTTNETKTKKENLKSYENNEYTLLFEYPVELGDINNLEKVSDDLYKIGFTNKSEKFDELIKNNYNSEDDFKLETIFSEAFYHKKSDILFIFVSYSYSNEKIGIDNQVLKILNEENIINLYEINNLPSSGKKGVSVMHSLIFNYISKDNKYLITRECIYMCNDFRIFDLKTLENYNFQEILNKDKEFTKELIKKLEPNINIETLEFLDNNYLKDQNSVFKNNITSIFKLQDIRVNTFSSFNEIYFKDENGIYYITSDAPFSWQVKKIDEADLDTFTTINKESDMAYTRDKNNIYYYGEILKNATIDCYKSPCYKK